MAQPSVQQLVALFSAGLALMVLASTGLVVRRWPVTARLGIAGAVAIGSAVPAWALDMSSAAAWPVLAVAGSAAVVGGLGSVRLAAGVQAAFAGLRRPGTRAAILAVSGLGLAAGGLVKFDTDEQAALDRDMEQMLTVTYKPPVHESTTDRATTDGGRNVTLHQSTEPRDLHTISTAERQVLASLDFSDRVIRQAPASDACNCHGWVFTGGRYWLSPEDVEHILADNGYQSVSDPRPGDLAIYRSGKLIGHTAVVRATGSTVLVEGKWGWMGVFLHPVGGSCYGTDYTFYRSPREGHLLAGLGGPTAGPVTVAGH